MMAPSSIQPTTPQYQLSALNRFTVYTSRAAYLAATGRQAPAFDPTRPPQYWEDPSQLGLSGTITYLCVDETNAATGYTGQLTINCAWAASVNLPGIYTYPVYAPGPSDAWEAGPFNKVAPGLGPVAVSTLSLQADVQEAVSEMASLFPGQTLDIVQENTGKYYNVYGNDPRRAWYVLVLLNTGPTAILGATLLTSRNSQGVDHPHHWILASNGGSPASMVPTPVFDTPVTQPAAGTLAMATPIRALLPDEQITNLPGNPLFNPGGSWIVENTTMTQPAAAPLTDAQQFTALTAEVAQLQADMQQVLAALAAKT